MKKFILIILTCVILLGCNTHNFLTSFIEENFKKEQISLLELHNKERTSRGYKSLILDEKLCEYAQTHAKKMAKTGDLYHSSMNDLQKVNEDANWVAENIAWGQTSEQDVVISWMKSTGHRWNILGSGFTRVGFGLAKDSKDRIYWCAVFSD
jgi:uncharacterized protein YkwD